MCIRDRCKELGTGSFIGSSGRTKEEIQQAEEELCIRFAAEYHEYLERIGLASVEEHELTGLTKEFTEAELLKREKEIEQRIEKAKQTREEFDEAMV